MRRGTTSAETTFRLRSIVSEPYRAGAGALQDRAAGPPRSLDEIEAALKTIPSASIDRRKLSFVVEREGEENALRAVFPVNRRELAVADFSFAGNEMLTIEAALALVPLFGPVALGCAGKDLLVVDGSETIDVLRQRRQGDAAANIEDFSKTMEQLNELVGKLVSRPTEPPAERKARVRKEALNAVLGLIAFAAFACLVMYGMQAVKRGVGKPCTKNDDCRYNQCLPRELMKSLQIGDFSLPQGMPSNSAGVCTVDCKTDDDCPSALRCGEAREVSTFNGQPLGLTMGTAVQRCIPRAWEPDAAHGS